MAVVLGGGDDDKDDEPCVMGMADGEGIEVGTSALASVAATTFSEVEDVF